MHSKKRQEGVVLLVAMVFLIVITIIGVSAVSTSTMKTQVAGNNMSSMLVYTGAESTLAKTASDTNEHHMMHTVEISGPFVDYQIPSADIPDENVSAAGVLTSTSQITYEGDNNPCPIGAFSSEYTCKTWTINAQSRLRATNARDWHIKGIAKIGLKIP